MTKKLNIDIIARDKSGRALKQVQGNLAKTKSSVLTLKNALIGIGAGLVLKQIASISAEFEDLRDSLSSVTGSVDAGREAFDFIKDFATRTQFGVQELTRSFITLKASGIEPTEKLLRVFTDTAAVTTDQLGTLDALTRVFSRGVQGGLGLEELNQIADRGVPVFRLLEEQLGITRLEISKFGQTTDGAKKILDALQTSLGQEFAGATEQKLDNLSTATSNFQIALANAADTFGEAGFSGALTNALNKLTEFIEFLDPAISKIGQLTGATIDLAVNAFDFVGDTTENLIDLYKDITGKTTIWANETEYLADVMKYLNEEIENNNEIIEKSKNTYKSKVDLDKIVADAELKIQQEAHEKMLQEFKRFDGEMRRRDIANTNFSKNEAKRKVELERQAQGQIVDAVGDGLSKVSGLNKDAFRAYQAFQIAMTTLNTFRAASNALAAYPFPLNIGVAAAETARGLATVAQIRATAAPRISGGRVNAGEPYMVGEGGRPELFVPQSSGTIVPNNQLGSPNINITINANDTEGFDDLLLKRRSTIINVINDALNTQGKEALI